MTWAKLHTGFFTNPKAIAAGKDGMLLFLAGICWSKEHATEGLIPDGVVGLIARQVRVPAQRTIARLVTVGLWHDQGEHGYSIHDWDVWNPLTAAEEKAKKERHAAKMRRLRAVARAEAQPDPRAVARAHDVPRIEVEVEKEKEVPIQSLSLGTVVAAEGWRERELPDEPTRLRVNGWNL